LAPRPPGKQAQDRHEARCAEIIAADGGWVDARESLNISSGVRDLEARSTHSTRRSAVRI
jgi:hypothetical protein